MSFVVMKVLKWRPIQISFDYVFKIRKQQTKALQYSLMWRHVVSYLGSNV